MISVIMPMFNSVHTIKNALDSVLNQTYEKPIEIVIVNDGSTDGCEEIVEDIIANNQTNRIIKLINRQNGGVSSARNVGIKTATGKWIALLDSDDVWRPQKLQKQMQEISKNPNVKFIGAVRNAELYPYFSKAEQNLFTLNVNQVLTNWYPHTSSSIIEKSMMLKVNLYDESRSHAEDGDLLLKIVQHCDLYVLNEDLVYTGEGKRSFGESGLSANISKMYEGEILALKGARKRKQIRAFEYFKFYLWLTTKYLRRIVIIKVSK